MSRQMIMVRSNKTQIGFCHGILDPTPPGRPLSTHGAMFPRGCSIVTVLKRAFSREQNTRRDDEEENSGSGKSKNFYEISGYGRFLHGKSGFNISSGGPLYRRHNMPLQKFHA